MARTENPAFQQFRRDMFGPIPVPSIPSGSRAALPLAFVRSFERGPVDLASPASIAETITELQHSEATILKPNDALFTREANPEMIQSFLNIMRRPGKKTIWMRHGLQKSDTAEKIPMMQEERNVNDPATENSLAEAFGFALLLNYVKRMTGKTIRVRTSENMRAGQIGAIIAEVTEGEFGVDRRLNCLNYSNELTEVQRAYLAAHNGTVDWNEPGADLIFGEGSYRQVNQDMQDLTEELAQEDENVIEIVMTHTQQLNGKGIRGRLGILGFAASSDTGEEFEVYQENVYSGPGA